MNILKALFSKRGETPQKKKSKRKSLGLLTGAVAMLAALPTAAGAAPIDFSGTQGLEISTTDVVSTGFSFANQFNEYTMLILGIMIAAVVVGFIIWLWRKLPKFGGGSKAS